MYCSINEAYNKPDREYINNNKANDTDNMDNIDNDYKLDEHVTPCNKISQQSINSFFNAQGDMDFNPYPCNPALAELKKLNKMYKTSKQTNDDLYAGTMVADLINEQEKDSLSLLDSDTDLSIKNNKSKNKKSHKIDHDYHIKKFIQQFIDDNDMISMTSSQDDIIYDHVKKCKYCKSQIATKLKDYYNKKNKKIESFKPSSILPKKIMGYSVKEIIIVILIGICIIFLLDLFVKIGKKIE